LRSAGVDTWVRGEEHASDHAPAWIDVELKTTAKTRKRQPSKS
jgi:hypothetical protein